MASISTIERSATDAFPRFLDGLRAEFDWADVDAIGQAYLAAERADFHWESRMLERHLGVYEGIGEGEGELDRVIIIGLLEGRWYVAICLVDGEGSAVDMFGLRAFGGFRDAQNAFYG